MTRRIAACPFVFMLLAAACGGPSPSKETEPGKSAGVRKDVIVLSAAEQAAGGIETTSVAETNEPPLGQVAGRIARADDRTWHVGVRTVGVVASVSAALGSYVEQGDVLARYHADEARELRAQYRQAVADARSAEASAALAERTADRYRTLLSLKAASVQQTEQAQQDVVAAQARLRDAEVEVDRAREALEHDLKVAIPSLTSSEPVLDDEVPIIAPGSGYVLEKNITPGKAVELSTDAFVIGDLSTVWMLASVQQEQVGHLRVGQKVTVAVPGLPGRSFAGTITNLGQELDPQTRTLPIRITLANAKLELKPEMLATADLPLDAPAPRLVVASDAVQQVNGQDVVFVKSAPDRFTVRPIRTGVTSAGRTPVLEGLQPGEQVVVKGSFVLKSHLLRASIAGE